MKKVTQYIFVFFILALMFLIAQVSEYNLLYRIPSLNEYMLNSVSFKSDSSPNNISYDAIEDEINDRIITSNLFVSNYSYDNIFELFLPLEYSSGSAAIFAETDDYYYALTNSHVVSMDNQAHQVLIVTDHEDHEYRGFVYEGSINLNLDLAILVFEKANHELNVMDITNTKIPMNYPLIAIGNPNSNRDTITTGTALYYERINTIDDGVVYTHYFEALHHSAETHPGSSGGMVIDYNLNIVGLSFASVETNGNTVSAAIPSPMIYDYLRQTI